MRIGSKGALLALTAAAAIAAASTPVAAQQGQAKASTPAARIAVPPIDFTERKLANRLRVIAIRDTSTPNVAVSVWYDVGAKHDPEGRSGFAHLFEHILSRKTRNMPYNMINNLTENVGGVRNASTSLDRTNYYDRLGTDPLTADEVEQRKTFVSGVYTLQSESSAGFASILSSLIQQGVPPADAARYIQQIQSVTPEAASTIAGRTTSGERASLVIVGDASKFIDRLRAMRPDVEVIPADQLDLDRATLRKGS